jgi:hypothetical protein
LFETLRHDWKRKENLDHREFFTSPRNLTDEVKSFVNINGVVCLVRVRSFAVGKRTAVLFSENRIPHLYPKAEVINPGTSITNLAAQLVYLARFIWGLVPDGNDAVFFEHYCGLSPCCQPRDAEATLAEIKVPKDFTGDLINAGVRAVPVMETPAGPRNLVRLPSGMAWPTPEWRHVDLDDGEQILGIPLHFTPDGKGVNGIPE